MLRYLNLYFNNIKYWGVIFLACEKQLNGSFNTLVSMELLVFTEGEGAQSDTINNKEDSNEAKTK